MNQYEVKVEPFGGEPVLVVVDAICVEDAIVLARQTVNKDAYQALVGGQSLTFAERSALLSKYPCKVVRIQ